MKIIQLLIFSLVFVSCTVRDKENHPQLESIPQLKPIVLKTFSGIELNTSIKKQQISQQELTLTDSSGYLLINPKGKLSNILGAVIENIEISTFKDSIVNVNLNFEMKQHERRFKNVESVVSLIGYNNIVPLYTEKYGIPESIKSKENHPAIGSISYSEKYTWENNDVIIQYIVTQNASEAAKPNSTRKGDIIPGRFMHKANQKRDMAEVLYGPNYSITQESHLSYNSKYLQSKIDSILINRKSLQDSLRLMKENKRRQSALEKI